MRSFAIGALGVVILFLSAPAWSQTMTMREGYWVRMQPSSQGEGVRINDREQVVTVVETGNGWVLARFADGRRYWVSSNALTEYIDVRTGDGPDRAQTYYARAEGAALRNKPGTRTAGSEIIDYVRSSTPLEVVTTQRDSDGDLWYKVKYNEGGRELLGYIYEGRVRADNDSTTEACATCAGAGSTSPGRLQTQAENIEAIAAGDAKGYRLGRNFVAACNQFINRDGLGPIGRLMIASAQRIARDCFYENRQIFADLCPNYQSLSTENKNSFIALVFASIAQVESSCNPSAQNPHGSNDIADGLFQLEYSRRQRAEAGRNERWCQTRNSVDTQSLTFQSQCAVSTIEDTVCRRDRRLNYRSGYWQKLQGDQRISRLIRNEANRWGLCN